MAKENMEIGEIVRKCKILLLDIEGTTTAIGFVKDKLFPYAEENVKVFLETHWEKVDAKEAVAALRKQATEDHEKSVEGLVAIAGEDASKEEQIESLVNNVKWQMSADRKVGPLKQLQGIIWKEGYDNDKIKGHVYDDVCPALELWRSMEGHKVYIYSSGSVQAQKLLFNKSLAGDMLPLIDGHFDTAVGAKQEPASYTAIVEKIGCKAEEILFLTDIVKEAEAARSSGLHAALVSREGNAPLPAEATASFPVLHSFDQLAVTNKRKPETQVEEVPAKVPKTDVQEDVKSVSDKETGAANGNSDSSEATKPADAVEPADETMEVEETPDSINSEANVDSVAETATAEVLNDAVSDVHMAETVENKEENSSITQAVIPAKEESFSAETLIDAAKVSDENIEVKTKMVDAATVTDCIGVAKTADAATETTVELPVEELKSLEAPIEQGEVAKAAVETKPDEAATAAKTEKDTNDTTESQEAKGIKTSEAYTNGSEVSNASNKVSIKDVVAETAQDQNGKTSISDPVEIAVEDVTDQKAAVDVPVINIEPVIEEIEEKTESQNTTVTETYVSVNENNTETNSESCEPIENPKAEDLIEKTTAAIEIKDITDDKQSLGEVTETIEDVVPIVEEPLSNREADELQNAGDVLEKECDEILSKVQDVTNFDFVPVKPLQTISEEMETESSDSTDIVERILDTEMELSIKPKGIDQDVAQVPREIKTDAREVIGIVEKKDEAPKEAAQVPLKEEMDAEKPIENQSSLEKNNGNVKEAALEPTVEKMETEVVLEGKLESDNADEVEDSSKTQESNSTDTEIVKPAVQTDISSVIVPQEATGNNGTQDANNTNVIEPKVNGKSNGNPIEKLNGNSTQDDGNSTQDDGNSTQDDELKSRLAGETNKEKVNGSNGDSSDAKKGQSDNQTEAEIADIKVKTVATDEVRAPMEQPVEA